MMEDVLGVELSARERLAVEARIASACKKNAAVCDFLIGLFVASAKSYRKTSICSPFPSHYYITPDKHAEKNFAKLSLHLEEIPHVHRMAVEPELLSSASLEALLLLDWILHPPLFHVKQISIEELEAKTRSALVTRSTAGAGALPQYVFEIVYNEEGGRDDDNDEPKQLRERYVSHAEAVPLGVPSAGSTSDTTLGSTSSSSPSVNNSTTASFSSSFPVNVPMGTSASSFSFSSVSLNPTFEASSPPTSSPLSASSPSVLSEPSVKLTYPVINSHHNESLLQDVFKNRNSRFAILAKEHSSVIGYHASSLENFHSIIHNGLDVKYSEKRQGLYGNGIYLSTDAGVCMSFIEYGINWPNSVLGRRIGMMVGCEVAEEPESVKRGTAQGRGVNPMPEQYILSTSNDCVRAKYVLVLSEGQQQRAEEKQAQRPPLLSKNTWIIIAFVLLLALVSFLRSGYWKRLRHRYLGDGLY